LIKGVILSSEYRQFFGNIVEYTKRNARNIILGSLALAMMAGLVKAYTTRHDIYQNQNAAIALQYPNPLATETMTATPTVLEGCAKVFKFYDSNLNMQRDLEEYKVPGFPFRVWMINGQDRTIYNPFGYPNNIWQTNNDGWFVVCAPDGTIIEVEEALDVLVDDGNGNKNPLSYYWVSTGDTSKTITLKYGSLGELEFGNIQLRSKSPTYTPKPIHEEKKTQTPQIPTSTSTQIIPTPTPTYTPTPIPPTHTPTPTYTPTPIPPTHTPTPTYTPTPIPPTHTPTPTYTPTPIPPTHTPTEWGP
jgi:hypothetical protein